LQRVGSDAAKEIGDRFDQLESEVKDKENDVVQTLATKYVEARKGLDERIEALQAENRGLVDKAIGAIKAVINTIRQLAAMLRSALSRAASVIGDIVGDPVGFLGNLISGIKGGIDKFFANITTHLKKGLLGWLFGQLGDAGIEIPDTFDLKGIVKLLASVFGLTWANIRNRLVRQIGETAMAAVERGVEIFQIIKDQGVAGLWDKLVEKIGDLKAMIVDQIQDFVITKIIAAGITWLISLLNPAAAFIKACKLIYDVVMFFVNNAERIAQFVNTVIDGVVDIAKGRVGVVVDKVESALGQMVPILIGFIASVLGIGGIGEKIRSIIQAIQRPINKALDFLIKTGLKVAGPIIRGIKGISTKVKAKVAAGKAWVKGKVEAGKAAALRLFKRTFAVGGESHTLATSGAPGALELTIASRKATVAAHQKRAAKKATRDKRPALAKEALEVINLAAAVKAKVNAKDSVEAQNRAAIDDLVKVIKEVWARIGYTGEPPREEFADAGKKGVVGEVGRHKDQGSRGYGGRDKRAKKNRLESEHVIPRAWIQAFISNYAKYRMSKKDDDRLYARMTTIMIYKGAADRKTEKQKHADNVALAGLRKVMAGHPEAKDPDRVSQAVKNAFAGPLASRIRLTKESRDEEHVESKRTGSPVPSDSAIDGAALRQLLDVVEFLAASIAERQSARRGR
ncbi:hypothetical protein, partial [Agromyces bracchium]